ncbi:MAG: DUF3426 domain-containing protein [Gammaproteobacteria bacterium]|nr:DUF3426 domain-containing protein [Gammaproteobacteria bacterium]
MNKKTHLGNIMETRCPNCSARYRVTDNQLQAALGQVKCGECGMVFNSLQSLKSYEGKLPANYQPPVIMVPSQAGSKPPSELSLHEAMYGHKHNSLAHFAPLLWFIGIMLLVVAGIAQVIYYQRYQLIKNPDFQQQVLTLCELVPCGESGFSSISQIKLLERNVFTHPVTPNALMVTGSFVNQASFEQKPPNMLVSLFDTKGSLIANRVFKPGEYLQNAKDQKFLPGNKPVQFRLEIVDPGTDALTYEFELF